MAVAQEPFFFHIYLKVQRKVANSTDEIKI